MASSLLDHSRRPTRQPQPQPQLDSEPIQVAPYLTHVVAHHGQLTLIPPQNAGRIRKSKSKKKRQPSSRDRRLEDDEPRFTTAVPASSSRKLHPAPAHIRTRKHAISAPSPTTPTAPRRFDPVPDDQSIPDYPPPSFEDAIASPHVPPSLVHPQSVQNAHPHGSISPESPPSQQVQHLQQYPYSSHVASLSSATILSSAPSVNGPASISQPSSGHQPFVGPQHSTARLASMSTTTLLSPATTATESTALSEMSLLRPPRPRTMPQPSPLARSNSGPFRLASPSTTTLVVPVTAMRDSPAISQTSLSRPQETYRHPGPEPDIDEEPESPIVEPLTPLSPPASPHPHYRGSISTVSDVVEELTFEPYQRWSADRRLGLSLEQRVQREFERRNITEAREAFGMTSRPAGNVQESTSNLTASGSMPSTPPSSPSPHARRCSHCGSVRPRDCGDTQTIDEHSDEDDPATNTDEEDEDEDHFPTSQRGSPLPRGAGRSPYLHPGPGTSSNARSRARFHSHSPEPGSPASPMSPSMSFFKMPSAWASTVTLSLAHALGPHKGSPAPSSAPAASPASTSAQPGSVSPPGSGLKRKESFGVRRLFGSLKGKEREREQRSREYAALQASPQAASTSISATLDSSDSSTESVDGWEVVGGGESPGARSSNGSTSTAPTSPARSTTTTEASSPTSESARAAAFLNRPVRHRSPTSPLLDSPISPLSHSPAHGPSGSPPTVTASPAAPVVATTAAAAAAARPYLPEKSPLRLIASANHIRQTYPHAHLQADPFAPPTSAPSPLSGTPRALRPSPSVVWKPPVAGANATTASTGGNVHAGSPNSPVQRSPLSQGSYPPPSQHLCPHTAQAQQQPQPQPQLHAKQQRHYQPPPPPHQQKPQPPPSPVGPRASPIPLAATYPMPPRTTETPAALPHTVLQSHEATAHTPTPEATSMSAPHTPVQPMAPLRRRRELTPPPSHRNAIHVCDDAPDLQTPAIRIGASADHALAESTLEAEVGMIGEPSTIPESLSIEQLIARSAQVQAQASSVRPQTPTRTQTTPKRPPALPTLPLRPSTPATPTQQTQTGGSTPTTPTLSQHYRGRPLPQLPPEALEAEGGGPIAIPVPIPIPIPVPVPAVKHISDGTPVNRVPEAGAGEDLPPPPSPAPSLPPSPPSRTLEMPSIPGTPTSSSPITTSAPTPAQIALAPSAPIQMERSESGDSVVEDARAAEEGPRPEFLQITDLDVLASRLVEDGARSGENYEGLLLVSEIIGPAAPGAPTPAPLANLASEAGSATATLANTSTEKATVPYIGQVEVQRRRVLKDGRVKLKLSLLGVAVDRCGVCLSQFRREERGALTPVCRHSFHEACLRRWLRTAGVCPICRMALSMDE